MVGVSCVRFVLHISCVCGQKSIVAIKNLHATIRTVYYVVYVTTPTSTLANRGIVAILYHII